MGLLVPTMPILALVVPFMIPGTPAQELGFYTALHSADCAVHARATRVLRGGLLHIIDFGG